jgi:peroxiredoxin
MLIPRKAVPELKVPTLAHDAFDLQHELVQNFSLIVFYRGLHCPLCIKYLRELGQKRGVSVIAISSDELNRAKEMATKIGEANLRFGYDLPLSMAKEWGLYISEGIGKTSIGIEEPKLFPEPGVFLIKPNQTLYYAAIQTMPFARPSFTDLLMAIDFAISKNYPARGEYTLAV